MAEKPPRYASLPVYDIEEQGSVYDGYEDGDMTEDDLLYREEMAKLAGFAADLRPSAYRRILCFVLAIATILSFTMSHFMYPQGSSVSNLHHHIIPRLYAFRLQKRRR